MVHTQRDNQIHEVAKSEIAPWFEGETGSSGRHRVLFNNGEEESEAEVVKVISRTWWASARSDLRFRACLAEPLC